MITISYFVHGTTTDNEDSRRSGWNDVGLSTLGTKQAMELGNQVANDLFDIVFCSDLKRAVKTAELGFGKWYLIKQDDRLREINYGDFNSWIEAKFPFDDNHYINQPYPKGESYIDVEKRMSDFIQFLKTNYSEMRIAIVSHRAPQLALEVLLKGKTWHRAITEDWRIKKLWKPGWEYNIDI